ncbi:hypothetical protein BJ166DRAFT_186342 [Pestalotiopsis sp. NC0098]|nr:hypothetical protein BJ166DRAFT_186342 [Pestalotiopsis sp. NC0098]
MSAPVQVRTFPALPRGRLVALTISGIVMLLSSRREVLAPGSPIYDYLLAGRPTALGNAIRVQNFLFYVLFGFHSVECVLFSVIRLKRHGVQFLTDLWWKWMLMCFVGGVSSWAHFGKALKEAASKQA